MKRPFRVSFLAVIFFISAVINCLRLSEGIFFWKTLSNYGASPLYIAISGGFWLLTALMIAIGLWAGKIWSWSGAIVGISGYESWYWIDRVFLQIPHANWPFALAGTIILLGISAFILFSANTRTYLNLLKRDDQDD